MRVRIKKSPLSLCEPSFWDPRGTVVFPGPVTHLRKDAGLDILYHPAFRSSPQCPLSPAQSAPVSLRLWGRAGPLTTAADFGDRVPGWHLIPQPVLHKEPSGKENSINRWEAEAQRETDQWACSSVSTIPECPRPGCPFVVAGTGSETYANIPFPALTPAAPRCELGMQTSENRLGLPRPRFIQLRLSTDKSGFPAQAWEELRNFMFPWSLVQSHRRKI